MHCCWLGRRMMLIFLHTGECLNFRANFKAAIVCNKPQWCCRKDQAFRGLQKASYRLWAVGSTHAKLTLQAMEGSNDSRNVTEKQFRWVLWFFPTIPRFCRALIDGRRTVCIAHWCTETTVIFELISVQAQLQSGFRRCRNLTEPLQKFDSEKS